MRPLAGCVEVAHGVDQPHRGLATVHDRNAREHVRHLRWFCATSSGWASEHRPHRTCHVGTSPGQSRSRRVNLRPARRASRSCLDPYLAAAELECGKIARMALSVLFLGGSGTISSACSWRAIEQGLDLWVLNRGTSTSRPLPPGARRLIADVDDAQSIAQAIGDRDFDAVVDWLAFTPDHVRARTGPVPRSSRSVRVHQLGLGLPDSPRAAAGHRVDPAAQPVLGVLPEQDRVRGPAHRALPRRRGIPSRSCVPRTPTTRRACRSRAGGPWSSGCAGASRSSCTATAPPCGP